MRTKKVTQCRVIHATDAHDYEVQFNKAMYELCDYSPTFTQDGFTAFIYYSINAEPEPECLYDEFRMMGRNIQCADCDYYWLPDDRRRRPRCTRTQVPVSASTPACDEWLIEIKRKEGWR